MNHHCVPCRTKNILFLTRNSLSGETDRGRRITPEVTLAQTFESSNTTDSGAHGIQITRTEGENGFSDDQQVMPVCSPIGRVVTNANPYGDRQPIPNASALGRVQMHTSNALSQSQTGSRPAKSEENLFAPPLPRTNLAHRQQHVQHRYGHHASDMPTHQGISEPALDINAPLMQFEPDPMSIKHQLTQQTFSNDVFEEPLPKRPAWPRQGLPGRANTWEGSRMDTAPVSTAIDFGSVGWITTDDWSRGAGQSDFDSQYNQMAEENLTTLLEEPSDEVRHHAFCGLLAVYLVLSLLGEINPRALVLQHATDYTHHAGQLSSAPSP